MQALAENTLAAAFLRTARERPDRVALRQLDSDIAITYAAWLDGATAVAGGLAARGVTHGDRIALLMGTCPEFHVIDIGALLLGAVPFSLYVTAPPGQLAPCVDNASARVLLTDADRLPVAQELAARCTSIECVVSFEQVQAERLPGFDVDASAARVRADDLCALVYTSGTTGEPKGVPYLHRGLMRTMASLHGHVPVSPDGRVISYLPMAHIAERMFSHYAGFVFGHEITSLSDPTRLCDALREVRPTRFFGVPRTFERVLTELRHAVGKRSDAASIEVAWDRATRIVDAQQDDREAEPLTSDDAATLAPLPALVGLDRAEWVAVAGAPAGRKTLLALHGAGIPVTEMYGMSETIIATANPPGRARIGTCGTALPGVEIKLAADSEILIAGETVMPGYFRNPDRTAEILRDGWIHSGDLGRLDDDGYLTIVDRKKALIINDGGKNMSPAVIEQAIKGGCPLIAHTVAAGDGRPHVVALVVLDPAALEAERVAAGIPKARFADLTRHQHIQEKVAAAVAAGNAQLSRVEQVRRFTVLDHEWTPGGNELTPTGKVRRDRVLDLYRDCFEELYQ